MSHFEGTNNELFHLTAEGLLPDVGLCLQDLEQLVSEEGIIISKLGSKGWEDCLETAAIFKVS